MPNDKNKIIISTGNILNVNKKAGQKTNEEVSYRSKPLSNSKPTDFKMLKRLNFTCRTHAQVETNDDINDDDHHDDVCGLKTCFLFTYLM